MCNLFDMYLEQCPDIIPPSQRHRRRSHPRDHGYRCHAATKTSRRLQPQVAADLFVYKPDELTRMVHSPLYGAPWLKGGCSMRRDARTEGLRWLEQAEADRKGARLLFEGGSYHLAATFDPDFETLRAAVAPLDGYYLPTRYPDSLPDSIPARIYTRVVAEEALRLTDQALHLLRTKLRREEPASQ